MKNKKINKKKVVILAIIVLAIIAIAGIVYMTTRNKEQEVISAEGTSVNTNTQIVAEIPTSQEEETTTKFEWQKDTPENHNIDTTTLNTLHNTYDSTQILSSLVIKDGYIVDEYFKDGYNQTSEFRLNSSSKSVTSALIGIAIDKGFIENVNVPISNYFPQILESDSEYLKQITIWHALTHTTGINASDTGNWDEWLASDNWVDYVLNTPVTSRPGTVFNYFTGNTHLLSAIIQQATGKTAYEFGQEHLFTPLGMDSVQADTDPQGITDGGNGFRMSIYDMAKFGKLFLDNGKWEGEQIISEQWVADSTKTQFTRSSGSANYGYQWWTRTFGTQNYPAYFAQGHAGQYIFVVPELELIVVYTSNHLGSSSMYWQHVNNIVNATRQ